LDGDGKGGEGIGMVRISVKFYLLADVEAALARGVGLNIAAAQSMKDYGAQVGRCSFTLSNPR
jgi:hypothetical protein